MVDLVWHVVGFTAVGLIAFLVLTFIGCAIADWWEGRSVSPALTGDAQLRAMLDKREHDHMADWERRFREECGVPAPPTPQEAAPNQLAFERQLLWNALNPTEQMAYYAAIRSQRPLNIAALPPPPDPRDPLLKPVGQWDPAVVRHAHLLHEQRYGAESFENFEGWLDQKRIHALERRVHDGRAFDGHTTVEVQRNPDPAGRQPDRVTIQSGRDVIAVW